MIDPGINLGAAATNLSARLSAPAPQPNVINADIPADNSMPNKEDEQLSFITAFVYCQGAGLMPGRAQEHMPPGWADKPMLK